VLVAETLQIVAMLLGMGGGPGNSLGLGVGAGEVVVSDAVEVIVGNRVGDAVAPAAAVGIMAVGSEAIVFVTVGTWLIGGVGAGLDKCGIFSDTPYRAWQASNWAQKVSFILGNGQLLWYPLLPLPLWVNWKQQCPVWHADTQLLRPESVARLALEQTWEIWAVTLLDCVSTARKCKQELYAAQTVLLVHGTTPVSQQQLAGKQYLAHADNPLDVVTLVALQMVSKFEGAGGIVVPDELFPAEIEKDAAGASKLPQSWW